jgi:8-oxo-dGTP pyrophosphatase MutT (NUDIX family)
MTSEINDDDINKYPLSEINDGDINKYPLNDYDSEHNKYSNCDLKKNLYCLNCGKKGHMIKKCKEPQSSYGIICFKITGDWSVYQTILQIKYYKTNYNTHLNNINLYWFNNKNKDIKDDINEYIDKLQKNIKILLIRRQHSIGYIEFIRGRYDINIEYSIINLLEQMTDEEKYYIINNNFNTVWEGLWKNTSRSKLYEKEFIKSYEKFDYVKTNYMHILTSTKSKFDIPEWGFPKGRRNYMEKDIECAKREFIEESGLSEQEFLILYRIYPINEIFYGTNQVKYKHVYFFSASCCERELKINENKNQIQEIGDIGWFDYNEVMKRIRPYHIERKKIVEDLIYFLAYNIKFYQENNILKTLKMNDCKISF